MAVPSGNMDTGPDAPAGAGRGRAGFVILDTEAVDRDGKARLDRRAGGGGQSDTQGENVGGPTVPFRGANRTLFTRFTQ